MIWVWAAIAVLSIFTVLQARKSINTNMTAGELKTTTSDEGASIPVIFGTVDVAPNCVAFKAGTPQAIKK